MCPGLSAENTMMSKTEWPLSWDLEWMVLSSQPYNCVHQFVSNSICPLDKTPIIPAFCTYVPGKVTQMCVGIPMGTFCVGEHIASPGLSVPRVPPEDVWSGDRLTSRSLRDVFWWHVVAGCPMLQTPFPPQIQGARQQGARQTCPKTTPACASRFCDSLGYILDFEG